MHADQGRRRILKLAGIAAPLAAACWWPVRPQRGVWTMDGRLGFFRAQDGIHWTTTDGRQGLFLPLGVSHALTPGSIAPDARHLAYTALDRRTGSNIWIAPIIWQGHPVAGTPAPFQHGSFDLSPRFSVDGRQITWKSCVAGIWKPCVSGFSCRLSLA